MKNKFILKNTRVEDNTIFYDYEITGEWEKYFNQEEKYYVRYSENIDNVDVSILNIPLISSFIILAWICDAEIICETIDEDFYNSLTEVKNGFLDIHNSDIFKGGKLVVEKLKNNKINDNNSIALFSGGVDANTTFFRHSKENVELCCIWGADVNVDNKKGWDIVENFVSEVSKNVNHKYITIKNPFRKFLNEKKCDELALKIANVNWYFGFEHSLAMLGSLAPYNFKNGIKNIYIASSYTPDDIGTVPCASYPRVDENICYFGCNINHDGYELNRQQKVSYLCSVKKEIEKDINLRVCWKTEKGDNCCNCEKCYRTIMGLYVEGENPQTWGFNINDKTYRKINKFMQYRMVYSNEDGTIAEWKYIRDGLLERKELFINDKNINWMIPYPLEEIRNHGILKYTFKFREFLKKIRNLIINK